MVSLALVYVLISLFTLEGGYASERLTEQIKSMGERNAAYEEQLADLQAPGRIRESARRLGMIPAPTLPVAPEVAGR